MPQNIARVSYGGRDWDLPEGQILGYGREATRTIRIRDPQISSRAGLLFQHGGVVWLQHDSASHGISVVPQGGHEILLPRRLAGAPHGVRHPLPGPGTKLRMVGRVLQVEIEIDSRKLTGPDMEWPEPDPQGLDRTDQIRDRLSAGQRELLAVLAEPLFLNGGAGQGRTMAEAAQRLELKNAKAVENRLVPLRRRLTELGADDLWRDDAPGAATNTNFVARLALLAYIHGWALAEDLPPS